MDIGFVLDASESITKRNWDLVLKFVKMLSADFKIGPKDTKFGLIRFASIATMKFGFKDEQYLTRTNFERRVSRLTYTYGKLQSISN